MLTNDKRILFAGSDTFINKDSSSDVTEFRLLDKCNEPIEYIAASCDNVMFITSQQIIRTFGQNKFAKVAPVNVNQEIYWDDNIKIEGYQFLSVSCGKNHTVAIVKTNVGDQGSIDSNKGATEPVYSWGNIKQGRCGLSIEFINSTGTALCAEPRAVQVFKEESKESKEKT